MPCRHAEDENPREKAKVRSQADPWRGSDVGFRVFFERLCPSALRCPERLFQTKGLGFRV